MNATSDLLLPYSLEIIYGGATLCPDKRIYMSYRRLQLHVTCKVMSITADPVSPVSPLSPCQHAPMLQIRGETQVPGLYLLLTVGPTTTTPATTFRPLNSQEAGVRPPAAVCSQVKTERVMCGVWRVQQPCNDVGEAPCPTWPQSRSRVKLSINIYTYL